MLHELEVNKALYGIESLSITNTTLEEVFLNSATGGGCNRFDGRGDENDETDGAYFALPINDPKNVNRKLIYFRQFQAIFYKKFIYWVRNLPFFCTMVAIPIIMTWLCFVLNNYLSDKTHMALELQLNDIKDPLVIVNFKENFKNQELLMLEPIIAKYGSDRNTKILILRDKSIEQEILDVADGNVLKYYDNLIGAVSIEMSHEGNILAKIFFSQNLIHSVAIMMNFVDNVMLKAKFPNHEIKITNR